MEDREERGTMREEQAGNGGWACAWRGTIKGDHPDLKGGYVLKSW